MTTLDHRMRTEHQAIAEVLSAADRSGLSLMSVDNGPDIRVTLAGDYGMRLVLEGPPRRVAAYLNRIQALGSGPFALQEDVA